MADPMAILLTRSPVPILNTKSCEACYWSIFNRWDQVVFAQLIQAGEKHKTGLGVMASAMLNLLNEPSNPDLVRAVLYATNQVTDGLEEVKAHLAKVTRKLEGECQTRDDLFRILHLVLQDLDQQILHSTRQVEDFKLAAADILRGQTCVNSLPKRLTRTLLQDWAHAQKLYCDFRQNPDEDLAVGFDWTN